MIQIKSILIPTDFSKQSLSALHYGIEFARKFGSKLHILHVVQDLNLVIPEMGMISPQTFFSIDPMLQAASRSIADLLEPYKHYGLDIVTHCFEGSPLDEILTLASEESISLIILGTHGHTGLAHLFLGSLAETLVRKAPCPVLTLRTPELEFISE